MGLTGCNSVNLGAVVLFGLPLGWLAFGALLWLLGAVRPAWKPSHWRGWLWGLVGSTGLTALTLVGGYVPAEALVAYLVLALYFPVPSLVACSLLLWRLLCLRVSSAWMAPAIITLLFVLMALPLLLADNIRPYENLAYFWVWTGGFWSVPSVVLIGLLIEAKVRRS